MEKECGDEGAIHHQEHSECDKDLTEKSGRAAAIEGIKGKKLRGAC
jgi:hypothetical protein